jgi:4-hydroxy-4-methyl-2-oxoglutarate aldolase
VTPGELIHADKHGFLSIPKEDQSRIYDASCFMDKNECETLIAAARSSAGKSSDEVAQSLSEATKQFRQNAEDKFRGGKVAY